MNFMRYADNRSQELAVKATREARTNCSDAEFGAIQFMLGMVRLAVTIPMIALFIPKVLWDFFLVNIHAKKMPIPQVEMLKAEHAAHEAHKGKKRTKYGFKEPVRPNEFN